MNPTQHLFNLMRRGRRLASALTLGLMVVDVLAAQDPVAAAVPAAPAVPANETPAPDLKLAIDPQADVLLRRMGDYLAQAQFYSVSAEVWQDIRLGSGQLVQAGRTIDLQVRRPDRFHAEVRSARRNRGLFYDGKSITLLDRSQNFYGSITAPATLDAALDTATERFGITVPLEDIIVSDSYQGMMGKVEAGAHLGDVKVLGVPCEHLAYSMEKVDWQIWIEQGARPVPRKIVITYKDEEGSPEYTAILSNWDFQTKLPDFVFTFEPPAGATKISVTEIQGKIEVQKTVTQSP
jgi:hypothetical protein